MKTLWRAFFVLAACGTTACAPTAISSSPDLVRLSRNLDAMHGQGAPALARHRHALLYDTLVKERPWCAPEMHKVFARPPADAPERRIRSSLPHYDWYVGPVRYRMGVDASGVAARPRWRVGLNVAVRADFGGEMELPACLLDSRADGPLLCEGTPYAKAEGLEACPASGRFRAPATRKNVRMLLSYWSREVEASFNRDAKRFGIPVRYDFYFALADEFDAARGPVDLKMPLRMTCGRTPYFHSLRTGWSIPILAHEMAHFLGLLDEYESLSGVSPLYPKTPFKGSEGSRMGISMKDATRFWPFHHYLIARRYHCRPQGRAVHGKWRRVGM